MRKNTTLLAVLVAFTSAITTQIRRKQHASENLRRDGGGGVQKIQWELKVETAGGTRLSYKCAEKNES